MVEQAVYYLKHLPEFVDVLKTEFPTWFYIILGLTVFVVLGFTATIILAIITRCKAAAKSKKTRSKKAK